MRYLRTISTQRLLALLAGVLIAGVGGTAIALAATSGGPVPRRTTLAKAIRAALVAKPPAGITARVAFTDNLVPSSDFQTSDPLLQGGTGRLWLSKDELRIELAGTNGDAELLLTGRSFWVYDPSTNAVLRGALPQPTAAKPRRVYTYRQPALANIQSLLGKLAAHLSELRAVPTDVAGRAAYRVTVSPKRSGGLVGAISEAWDAIRGVPLSFALYAKGDHTPVLALKATDISYGRVSSGVFRISPPSGAKTTSLDSSRAGWWSYPPLASASVFPDPTRAGGLARTSVRRLRSGGRLVSYGHGLGGVLVLEQAQPGSRHSPKSPAPAGAGANLTLPTRTFDGVTAQLLETEIGTILTFTRNGTSYTVAGSVPAAEALRVARAL